MTSVSDPQPEQTGPYATAAMKYHTAGWSPLPLPARSKGPVPTGWTGREGAWPSGADVYAWTEDKGDGNLALRLPHDVIGVDCDHYGDKPGGMVLGQLEDTLGELPPTWRSTARDDGTSGIRLYRAPAGRRWPSVLGPGIEVIRHAHRYTVAWPSVHPDTGGTYRWITPDGATALDAIPTPDDLPHLPQAWIDHFAPEEASEQATAGLSGTSANAWLTERGAGDPCNHTASALKAATSDLASGTSRHDAALAATNRLVWLAGEGHTGVNVALQQLGAQFQAAMGGDRDGIEAEWDRMIHGAIDLAAAAHPTINPDPCTDPFAGLISKETTWNSAPTNATGATVKDSSTTTTEAPPAPNATGQDSSVHNVEPERTSWWPRSLDIALGDSDPEPPPEHLTRDDGHAAFYSGRVNGLIGPSESGKTWVALHAAAQAIEKGQHVTYIDFEDSEKGIVGRLISLGCDPMELRSLLAYIGPDEPFHPLMPSGTDLAEHLDTQPPSLVVVDGVNAAMTLQGWDLLSNKDATAFSQQILKPLAKRGAAVVYVDHTPKDTENASKGGIGAQAKRAMTSGCTLRVDAIKPFGKGQNGKLRIHVDKDRQGDVRGISAPGKTTHWFGDFTLTHVNIPGDQGTVTAYLTAPEGFDPERPAEPSTFRPTGLMKKVSDYLQKHPGEGVRGIRDAGLGRKDYVDTARAMLVEEGWVRTEEGPRGKTEHHVDTPFDELLSPPNDCAPDRAPTVPPGHGQTTVPPVPPGPDVVRAARGTVETRDDETKHDRAPGAQSQRWVSFAGGTQEMNPATGEVRAR